MIRDKMSNAFVQNYFYKNWEVGSKRNFHPSLELIVKRRCNLSCKYCYYTRFGKILIPDEIDKIPFEKNLENISTLLTTFINKKIYPINIDIFSGQEISSEEYDKLFGVLYSYFVKIPYLIRKEIKERTSHAGHISFPLNVVGLVQDPNMEKVFLNWYEKFRDIGSPLFFSVSTDGKYCDPLSRPANDKLFKYDDDYYNKVKEFARKVNAGFHPMISPENIKGWKENIDWYLEYIREIYYLKGIEDTFNILYLLQVRNNDWSAENLKDLYEFITYLHYKALNTLGRDRYLEKFSKNSLWNILRLSPPHIGRGIGCSIQTTLGIRTGDMKVFPCHRLSYDKYEAFTIDPRTLEVFDTKHIETYITTMSFDQKTLPGCEVCNFRDICLGPCLGANHEYMNSMFVPDPDACLSNKVLILSHIKFLLDNDLYDDYIYLRELNLFKNDNVEDKKTILNIKKLSNIIRNNKEINFEQLRQEKQDEQPQ